MNARIFILLVGALVLLVLGSFLVRVLLERNGAEIQQAVTNFEECVAVGNPVMESFPRQCKTPEGSVFREDIGNVLEKENLIRVSNPRPNQAITSPLFIEGEARGTWFFEASFPMQLLDGNGNVIAQGIVQTPLNWMTEDFVAFQAALSFERPSTEKGTLVLHKDNPSGLPEHDDELRVPVVFGSVLENTTTVQVYFSKLEDPQQDCRQTEAVQREVAQTQAVARAAVEELLKGPTQEEEQRGVFTSINPGVEIQQLSIENGIARVDFTEQLEWQVGGSCRVAAIRAQIRDTLMQFSTVNEVIISINGRTEDILQP